MNQISNNEFIEFLESFKDNERYYNTITQISETKVGRPQSLIINDFEMYSFDEMCEDCSLLKGNLPKSTDAIFYKIDDNGQLVLYIIEFKFHDLNKPGNKLQLDALVDHVVFERNRNSKCFNDDFYKKIASVNKTYGDDVEFSLRLKPVETIMVALPAIYEDYCLKNDLYLKDIRGYLKNIKKELVVFVSYYRKTRVENKSRNHVKSMGSRLHQQYERLRYAGIIDDFKIKTSDQFDSFLKEEQLIESDV